MKSTLLLLCAFAICRSPLSKAQEPIKSLVTPQIKVFVCGAVTQPKACLLPSGAELPDAIKATGGFVTVAERVMLYRGVENGHARFFAKFKVSQIKTGSAKRELLLDGDLVVVGFPVYGCTRF